jgi:hypothetical protein
MFIRASLALIIKAFLNSDAHLATIAPLTKQNPIMKRLLPSAFVFILLSLACCKKENPTFSGAKVLTNTNLNGGIVDAYTYNSNGNVALITHSSGDKTVFTYSGDTVFMQYIIGGTVVSNATEYLLHGTYADTSIGLYQSQHNAAKYAYNSDGQLTQQKNYAYNALSSISDFSITGKNVVTITNTNVAANTHTYSYFTFSTNSNTIGNQNFGMGFLGVGNLYLPTKKVQLAENGDTLGVITYKYHFNGDAYVDTMVTYDRYGHLMDSLAYSY